MGNQCCDVTSCWTNRRVCITHANVRVRCVFLERVSVLQMFSVDLDTRFLDKSPKAEQQRMKVCRWKGPRCSLRQRGPEEGGRVFLKQWPNVLARVMHVGDSQLKNMLTLDGKLSRDKHGQKKPSFFNEHVIRNISDLFCNGIPERFTFFHPHVVYFSILPTMPCS